MYKKVRLTNKFVLVIGLRCLSGTTGRRDEMLSQSMCTTVCALEVNKSTSSNAPATSDSDFCPKIEELGLAVE
jgi:hypothetical protein